MSEAAKWERLFKTGQYGRFYVANSKHARGLDFRVQLLPEGEEAIPNGNGNNCLNKDAVLIFGPKWRHTGEQSGPDCYDLEWFYKGKWIEDFRTLADGLQQEKDRQVQCEKELKEKQKNSESERIAALLANY